MAQTAKNKTIKNKTTKQKQTVIKKEYVEKEKQKEEKRKTLIEMIDTEVQTSVSEITPDKIDPNEIEKSLNQVANKYAKQVTTIDPRAKQSLVFASEMVSKTQEELKIRYENRDNSAFMKLRKYNPLNKLAKMENMQVYDVQLQSSTEMTQNMELITLNAKQATDYLFFKGLFREKWLAAFGEGVKQLGENLTTNIQLYNNLIDEHGKELNAEYSNATCDLRIKAKVLQKNIEDMQYQKKRGLSAMHAIKRGQKDLVSLYAVANYTRGMFEDLLNQSKSLHANLQDSGAVIETMLDQGHIAQELERRFDSIQKNLGKISDTAVNGVKKLNYMTNRPNEVYTDFIEKLKGHDTTYEPNKITGPEVFSKIEYTPDEDIKLLDAEDEDKD
ncbi:hypothetical protein HON01_00130 [Candidatus Woesearchaeota archaeon]|jgi:hypothetical protein|nr:hypothetical protein [Candidatus Woesearchaeota archaeon]MBT7367435.1 hypothetical protein [Candidatus Woesearchaeota archaeon]